jgi:AcrR family transcriptional regulator
MKTAQRILSTALALFNEHGESAISSVDIANECDISPGNLYYHFKGKEQLVQGLMKLHRAQMDELLDKKRVLSLGINELFYYLFLIIQRLHLFRFLYRSPADLMEKYPEHKQQHSRFMALLESTLATLFGHCAEQELFYLEDTTLENITALTALVITQSCQYDQMMRSKAKSSQATESEYEQYHALSLLLTALRPRCKLNQSALEDLLKAIELHQLPAMNVDERENIHHNSGLTGE